MQQNSTRQYGITAVQCLPTRKEPTPTRTLCKSCVWVGLAMGLVCAESAHAFNISLISQGQSASGQIVQIAQLTFDPGESTPWHFHTGTAWVTVLSGTLTFDEGCGTPLRTFTAGAALSEPAGRVHRVLNLGNEPLVFTGVIIFPACDPNNGTVFVGVPPECEGNSGRSHLQPIPACND